MTPGPCGDPNCSVLHADPANPNHPPGQIGVTLAPSLPCLNPRAQRSAEERLLLIDRLWYIRVNKGGTFLSNHDDILAMRDLLYGYAHPDTVPEPDDGETTPGRGL